jgi:two-component system, chemotaxis family, sensor kinase CheA
MGQKNHKVIKTLQKIAEDIDNAGINDSDAWHKLGRALEDTLTAVPKKNKNIKELLDLIHAGLEAMGSQTVNDPLTLADAVWQGLISAEHCLSGRDGSEEQIVETRRKLEEILHPPQASDADAPSAAESDSALPSIESLDDAAALLVQLEPDNHAELLNLRTSLLDLIVDGRDGGDSSRLVARTADKINEIVEGRSADPERTLSEVGSLLERAMNPMADIAGPAEEGSESMNPSTEAKLSKPPEDEPDIDHMPQDADAELIAEFIAEGSDLISSAEEALLSLETDPADMESVGKVFRAFHTVKGTSAFLGLNVLSEFGHHAESLLSRVRDGEIRYGGGYADLSLRALDMIKELMRRVQAALSGEPLLKPKGYDDLVLLLANPDAAGISEETDDVAAPRVGDMLVAQGKIEREQVEEVAAAYPDQKLGVAMVKSKAASTEDVGQALRAQKRINSSQQVVDSSVRVGTQRLDRLIDMVGELVIAHSMVAQDELVANSDNHELAKKVSHTSKIVRELQDISMSMRMVPLKGTFSKMARLVRDVARKVGKNVNFATEGEDTEIDRNLVNIINDPLVHMVRNAVDHGIEPPDERKRNGKPEYGTVRLMAYHSAGSVVVEVRDDGKGLDRSVILAKAREKGLIGESSDSNDRTLSDREVFNMVFEPGFSTAQVVTDVSGRGVGMDVVKKNIEALRGQVEIKSECGHGSIFKMSLPLTLAIIDGMVVRVGSETYVIPTVSIIRSIRPGKNDLATVLNQGEIITLQGSLIPLFRVASLYHIDDAKQDAKDAVVVIVEDEDRQAGLLVDELIGRQQVVIKSLGETMKDIPGISGGAIMPDGRVGLIIDVGGLVKFANIGHVREFQEETETSIDRSLAAQGL